MAANGRRLSSKGNAAADLTLTELIAAFWQHATTYYRKRDGNPTSEIGVYKRLLRPVRQLYGRTLVAEFGPRSLIGHAFAQALAGETHFLENQRMFLDRNGYLDETFFTFSFSPIRDETGGVGGLFHPVTETTGRMLSERRTRAPKVCVR